MRSGYGVEQVFLRLRGGLLELEFVLVAPSGALKHDKVSFPTRNHIEGVRYAARHLASRGDVDTVSGVRLRVEQRGEFKDDPSLKRMFIHEFQDQLGLY
jgi:hypothetical protein